MDNFEFIENEAENLIEKKFRDLKMETKIISFLIRKDCSLTHLIFRDYFTIEPFQIFFDIVKKNKMLFQKDIFYRVVKSNVNSDSLEICKIYISKIFDEELIGVDKKHIEMFIGKLRELYQSRMLMKGINSIVSNVDKFDIENAKKILKECLYKNFEDKKSYGELLEDFEERKNNLIERKNNPKLFSGIPTGIKDFDNISGGLMKGEFGIIVASTGKGKSVALGNFALNAWIKDYNVLFVSLEMNKHQIEYRMDSRITRIFHSKFRKAELDDDDIKKWQNKIDDLKRRKNNFLEIVCLPRGCCVNDIEEEALRIQSKRNKNIDLIIIDYLNLMSSNDKKGDKRDWKYQAEIAWNLKAFSSDFNGTGIPVWTANQITDEGNIAKKIETHHLKYSRAIAEVCPVIIALHQSIDDMLQDILKIWVIKCRDFENTKRPIILHPKFNVMVLNQESIQMSQNGS